MVHRAGEGEPYFVELVGRDGRRGAWVQPVTRSAKVYYFPPTACPPGGICPAAETANYHLPETSISNTHVYFLDGDTVIRSLAIDGTVAVVKTIHSPPNSQVAFSVSPDDQRIAISIITLATSQSAEPVDVNMFVEDLAGLNSNRVSLYSSKTLAEWPIGWHAGNLVVAVGSRDLGTYDNAYAATGYVVVDPTTRRQLASLDCARGLLAAAGTACADGWCGTASSCGPGTLAKQAWDGTKSPFITPPGPPPPIFVAFATSVQLSPDGTRLACSVIENPHTGNTQVMLLQGGTGTFMAPGYAPLGWLDNDHLIVGSSQQVMIVDLATSATVTMSYLQFIQGQGMPALAGTMPPNLG